MLINTLDVAAAPGGIALQGSRPPWTSLSFARTDLVPAWLPVPAAGAPDARGTGLGPAPAMAAQQAAVAAALPAVDNRKQHVIRKHYVHKTRMSAGGDGAMGPHPEREPA